MKSIIREHPPQNPDNTGWCKIAVGSHYNKVFFASNTCGKTKFEKFYKQNFVETSELWILENPDLNSGNTD